MKSLDTHISSSFSEASLLSIDTTDLSHRTEVLVLHLMPWTFFPIPLSFTSKISIDRDNYSVTRLAQKTPADEINAFCWGNSPVYSRLCMIAGRLQLLQRKALSSAHLELCSAWNSDMLIFYWCSAALGLTMRRREKSLKMIFRARPLPHDIKSISQTSPPPIRWMKMQGEEESASLCEAVSRVSCWISFTSCKVACLYMCYFTICLISQFIKCTNTHVKTCWMNFAQCSITYCP